MQGDVLLLANLSARIAIKDAQKLLRKISKCWTGIPITRTSKPLHQEKWKKISEFSAFRFSTHANLLNEWARNPRAERRIWSKKRGMKKVKICLDFTSRSARLEDLLKIFLSADNRIEDRISWNELKSTFDINKVELIVASYDACLSKNTATCYIIRIWKVRTQFVISAKANEKVIYCLQFLLFFKWKTYKDNFPRSFNRHFEEKQLI